MTGAGVKTDAKTSGEHFTILWPAAARRLDGGQSKAPTLAVVKDQFGLDAWHSVEVPAEPGAALAWDVEVEKPGDFEVYIESLLSG